jgi:hypothetical protein
MVNQPYTILESNIPRDNDKTKSVRYLFPEASGILSMTLQFCEGGQDRLIITNYSAPSDFKVSSHTVGRGNFSDRDSERK